MYVNGTGSEYLDTVGAVLQSKQRDSLLLRVTRDRVWMNAVHAPNDRRSDLALHPDRPERDRVRKAMRAADPREVYIAALRALRELSDGPLEIRIGMIEQPKQGAATENTWQREDVPLQRLGERLRRARLFLVCSKVVASNVVVSGPTAVIEHKSRPDKAVLQVLHDIRKSDPDARIIGVELDEFDQDVGRLLRESRSPFALRLPALLDGRGYPKGPMAFVMPPSNPETVVNVEHGARDLRGLRAGRSGEWPVVLKTEVEGGSKEGVVVTRPVSAKVTEEILIRPEGTGAFRARIVRVADDYRANVAVQPQPLLVAVLGVPDPVEAIELAIQTFSTTDQHPRIALFLDERKAARVFAGEQRDRVLETDRATASIAFAALQLDRGTAKPAARSRS